MEKVIVTGANGFIGRNFIKFLTNKNIEVYAVDKSHENSTLNNLKNIHLIECDLSRMDDLIGLIENRGFDVFYHFAWIGTTGEKRADYKIQTENATYTCNAAIISKKLKCKKFITTGTITEKVAEGILDNHYVSESMMYGLSKHYTHNLLEILCKKENISYVWAKLSNIYGGDNTNGNLISYTIKEFQENRIPSYGPCEQPYNFTYIKDVIDALFFIGEVEINHNEVFISNGECRKLKDYLNKLSGIYDKKISIGTRKDDGIRFEEKWFDNSELVKIGFKSKYTFEQGIKEIRGEI